MALPGAMFCTRTTSWTRRDLGIYFADGYHKTRCLCFLDAYANCSPLWGFFQVGFPHPICWEMEVLMRICTHVEILAGDLCGGESLFFFSYFRYYRSRLLA